MVTLLNINRGCSSNYFCWTCIVVLCKVVECCPW